MKISQYRKKGIALIFLAKKFYLLTIGDRVPTVSELCEEIQMSRGTIQSALEILKNDNVISTVSKGKMGTFITSINKEQLVTYLDNKVLVGAMPLPYTKHYEGLATSLYEAFESQTINLNLAYVSGGLNRLDGLLNDRYDFIVTSGLTADQLIKENNVSVACTLPEKTYLSEHVVLFNKDSDLKLHDGMRVGIDSYSLDYSILTSKFFKGYKIEKIESPYNQIVQKIVNKEIDAAIWNKDEVKSKNSPVAYREINGPLVERGSQAVILVKKNNVFVKSILSTTIDYKNLVMVQEGVISETRLPRY